MDHFKPVPYGIDAGGGCLVVLLSARTTGQFEISNNAIGENSSSLSPSVNL